MDPILPHFSPPCPCWVTSPLNGPQGVIFSQIGSWGLPSHSSASKMCLGPKKNAFGVPVRFFLVEAHPFRPHRAQFCPPWHFLGHVAFKWSPGGKFLTGRFLRPPNPFQCILNVFGTKTECFGVPVSMFLVDAHPFGPHFAHFGLFSLHGSRHLELVQWEVKF